MSKKLVLLIIKSMAIKVNARETELKIGKKPGYYYVMTPDLYIALAQK